jgi:RNA polymerase sigma-70 factor, ECF subfamily
MHTPLSIIECMQEFSDEELVANFRSDGGPPAGNRWMDELFGRYHQRVALWCYRSTGDREWATDLAQDVFLRAYRNIDSFRGQAKFSTWLYTIVRNHCINELKSRAVRPSLVTPAAGDPSEMDFEDPLYTSVLDELERKQTLDMMRTMMQNELDETERKVMTLHFADGVGLDPITRLLALDNPSGARAYVISSKRKLAAAVQRWRTREAGPYRKGRSDV